MAIEAYSEEHGGSHSYKGDETGEAAPVVNIVEGLINRRRSLAVDLGVASRRLVAANEDYVRLIAEIQELNTALHAAGIDTYALAVQLQAELNPVSAIADYGRPDID